VVSIEFTMLIWTAILAASFLGERMTLARISAIVLGLVGVIMIVRPANRRHQSGLADRARRRRRVRNFRRHDEIADP
jgi:drug/metabolite transporter (DMT)-like permease